ncbi:hypothetical protein Ndes2526A_g03964 [Nannochloris sp. 'desiccata']
MRSTTKLLSERCKTLFGGFKLPRLLLRAPNDACSSLVVGASMASPLLPHKAFAENLSGFATFTTFKSGNSSIVFHRPFGSSAPGADLAQRILAADSASDLAGVTPMLEALDPSGLPAVARAAAVTAATDSSFREALVGAAVRGLPSLAPADLCSVVESLAELRAYSVAFKDATADQVLARLDEFSGDMLGHTLRAFGSMQYYDDELLEGVVSHMSAFPEKFSAENVADVVYALSQSNFCHPDLVSIVQHAGELLLKEAALDRGDAIASIVDAYSQVGCSDSEVLDELLARVAASPDRLAGEALAKLVTATVRLGCEDERLLGQLLDAMVSKLGEVSPKVLINMVAALGELGVCHNQFLNALTDHTIPERLGEFQATELSNIVNSLNKVGFYNQEFMALLEKQEVQKPPGKE